MSDAAKWYIGWPDDPDGEPELGKDNLLCDVHPDLQHAAFGIENGGRMHYAILTEEQVFDLVGQLGGWLEARRAVAP